MFNLDYAIANWRRQMIAGGLKHPATLDELESHLREDVDQQVDTGTDVAEAFSVAVQRMGQATALKGEFSKLGTNQPTSLPKIFRIACFVSAPFMFLVGTWALWDDEIDTAGRMLAQVAVIGLAFYLAGLPFWYRYLPNPEKPRVRAALKLMSYISCVWILLALLDASQIIPIHFGNLFSLTCWGLYTAYAFTVLAYHCRCLADATGRDALPDPDAGDFTELAQASLEAARQEAVRLHHDYIGTEHVLLGILATESILLMDVLRKSFLDRETVRREIEKLVGTNPDHQAPRDIPFTPRARRAFGFAAGEARAMKQSFISAEHVFLGLLLETEGVAGLVLRNLGFDFEIARAEILKGFGTNGDDGPQPVVVG
jgi:hypothetical protein